MADRTAIHITSINLQHYLWSELFGYLIHPDIPTRDPHLRIADVGTGTGSVLDPRHDSLLLTHKQHLAHQPEWSTTQIRTTGWARSFVPCDSTVPMAPSQRDTSPLGCDKGRPRRPRWSLRYCPYSNFCLCPAERRDPVCLGKPHQAHPYANSPIGALLVIANNANNNLIVGPGGYLQWAEPDVASYRIEKTNSDNKVDALGRLLKLSQGQDARLSPTWVPDLASLFTNGGLGDVQTDIRDAPPHLAFAMHECNLMIHELIARKTHNDGVVQELTSLMPEILNESREGPCWAFTRWVVVGRKPH